MRIALACPYAWDAPGGVQTHVRQLARHLRERGHRTLVLAPAFGTIAEPGVASVGRPVRIPFNGSVAPVAPTPTARRRVRSALRRFRPDVVHAHEPLAPGVGLFAATAGAAPVVGTFHAYADRATLLRLAAPALRRVWRRLAVRIAVSEAARAFVMDALGPGEVRIVPNGADVSLFRDAAAEDDLPPGRRVLFVNRLEPRKGFATMVAAFGPLVAAVPDAVLVVAGDGPERRAVDTLEPALRGRVVMLGTVPHEDLPPFHAASHAFAAPATGRESFGIVLVEAMAAGLPVVASDIAGYREVVRRGVDGLLVPPRDPVALARVLARVLTEPDLARGLAEAGRSRAEAFDWSVVAARIAHCYEEAVAGAG